MADEASHGTGGSGGSGSAGGWPLSGLLRGLGTMLGVHLQYAQREARGDLGRVIGGVVLLVVGVLLVSIALFFAHVALVVLLKERTPLDLLRSVAVVALGDLLLGGVLLLLGRARLRKPILKETRSLVRQTAKSLVEL